MITKIYDDADNNHVAYCLLYIYSQHMYVDEAHTVEATTEQIKDLFRRGVLWLADGFRRYPAMSIYTEGTGCKVAYVRFNLTGATATIDTAHTTDFSQGAE